MRYAQVTAVYPALRRVDLTFTDYPQRLAGVPVMSPDGSSDGGSWNVPNVDPPSSEAAAGGLATSGRSLIACVDMDQWGRAVVRGFLAPLGFEALNQQDRQITRHHASGAYTTIAPDGSLETWHPSGAYMRIGAGAHEDLSALAVDGKWTVPAGAAAPTITVTNAQGTLTIDPTGNVDFKAAATMKLEATGAMSLSTQSTLSVSAAGKATFTASGGFEFDGDATFTGNITAAGTITGQTDVVAAGISGKGHLHGGVESGGSKTSPPATS